MTVQPGVPQGTVHTFTMRSTDSKIYLGIARDQGSFGTVDPNDPARLVVTTSRPAPWTRQVAVYIPKQYVPGTAAPFIVGADGPDPLLFTALDNLIHQKRVPVMIAISIANGGGDAQGSQRGLEYDTMSGRYNEFVETEVLPLVEKQYNVRLTKDPDGRATMGCSSGAAAAFIMAWYGGSYRRVLSYSGTYVNQQWPHNPETPGGAWELHARLIPTSPAKPIRIWMHVGDRDLLNPNVMRDNMHDWVLANQNMAKVLAAKGYRYQFVFARNAAHCDRAVKLQTLPAALEWLWKGYPVDSGRIGGIVRAQSPDRAPGADTLPRVIPIFPLELPLLFPGVSRPLHIFEARYRTMVADALKGDRIIGMTTLKPGYEADYQGRPPIFEIGCAGVITDVEELPGGRYNIVLRGLVKFRVTSEDASRPYRLASVDAQPEVLDDAERAELHRQRLVLEDLVTSGGVSKVPPEMGDEELVNVLAQYVKIDHAQRQALLELKNVLLRSRALIDLIESNVLRPR
jgi:Lon protease-like protein/enterochelin esterase-like enzyme